MCCALLLGIAVVLLVSRVNAQETAEFDIPAQPLAAALAAYGTATRLQLFVDSSLTSGRRSAAIKGTLAPETALRLLLVGTGLLPQAIRNEGFTLIPLVAPVNGTEVSTRSRSVGSSSKDYSPSIQAALKDALCRDERLQSEAYRSLLQLWIDASGKVTTAILLTSTGDDQRDARLVAMLTLLVLVPPPAGLPQPVTLILAPSAASCGSEGRRADSAAGVRR